MNRQTRSFRPQGVSRKVQKGQSDPDNTHSGYTVDVAFDIFKGRDCVTEFSARERNSQNKRKSAWQGAGKRPMRERAAE